MAQVEAVQQIELEKLTVHKSNPRADVGDVGELRASIEAQGILEPLIAVREDGQYAVVAGSRRLAAAKLARLATVPVLVRDYTEEQIAAAGLIENLQREDLNPLEEARGYRAWLDLTKKTQAELAKAVGKAPSTVANALRVLDAAAPIQKALEKGDIMLAHAKIAMSVPERALTMVDLKAGTSVKELEEQANVAKKSDAAVERLREAITKARAEGKKITWAEGYRDEPFEVWVGSASVPIERIVPKRDAKLVGKFNSYSVTKAAHDQVCECTAVAIDSNGRLEGACISPTGWKKAEGRYRANMGKASPQKKKRVKTAEDRAKELARDTKAAILEATAALDGKKLRSYHPLKLNVAPALLKGGIGAEPGRLALFGYVVEYSSGDNKSKTWEIELWKKIAKLPLKAVREQLTKWAIAAALDRIDDTNRHKAYGTKGVPLGTNNATVIRGLVNAHYGVRATAKKAKR